MGSEQLSEAEQKDFQDKEAAFWAQSEVQERVVKFRQEVAAGTVALTDMAELQRILVPESTQA